MCHEMIGQKGENIPEGKVVKEFVHPADIGDALYKVNCSDCHMAAVEDSAGGDGHGKH